MDKNKYRTFGRYRGKPCIECGKPVDHDWYSHRKCRACNTKSVRENYDPQRARQNGARLKYGVDLKASFIKFPNCGICKTKLKVSKKGKKLANAFAIDHDHETGQIRGMLCNACNRGMGLLSDSISNLKSAIAWLEKQEPSVVFLDTP